MLWLERAGKKEGSTHCSFRKFLGLGCPGFCGTRKYLANHAPSMSLWYFSRPSLSLDFRPLGGNRLRSKHHYKELWLPGAQI